MKRKVISIILVLVILLHMCGFVFAENVTNEEKTNELSLTEQQKEVTDKLNTANEKLEYVQSELSTTMLRVQELEDKVLDYKNQMSELSQKLDTLQASIDEAKQDLSIVENDYNDKEEQLRERLVTMYESGETTYLDVLLSSRNIVEFISGYYLITELVEYDNELIEEVETKKNDIEIKKAKLEKEETEIRVLKSKREQTTVILQNTITMQQNEVAKLNEQEKKLQQEISTYKAEQAQIEAAIQAATNSTGDFNIQYTGGEMLWPVAISGTYITSGYGVREHPIQGISKMHTGIDIGNATYGSPVVAAADGVVTYAGWLGGYGNCVMINHGDGLVTLYGHGQKVLTELHKEVKQGDLIMEVGSTGNSTGPHLHFEVRLNGTSVQPLNYVKVPSR